MLKLLLIDNELSFLGTLKDRLLYESYKVEATDSIALGLEMIAHGEFDVLICDRNCFETILQRGDIKAIFKGPVLVVTNPEACRSVVEMMKKGAYDVVKRRPCDLNLLLKTLRECSDMASGAPVEVSSAAATASVRNAKVSKVIAPTVETDMIGESSGIQSLKLIIEKVAPSDARVLVTGENGTGKELVAKWLHNKSYRKEMPFVEVNCAAIPSELIESELFGHEKGAFTSAVRQRKGRFEQANGGTLFLDEVGDMSLSAQAKVLRALQEGKITRVGGDADILVDVRIVAATNKNLKQEIERGNFREDLFHRLSVIVLHVPSLAERKDDIPQLVDHFMNKISADYGVEPIAVRKEAMSELRSMGWSGNIRELRNVVERLLILCENEVTAEDVKMYVNSSGRMIIS